MKIMEDWKMRQEENSERRLVYFKKIVEIKEYEIDTIMILRIVGGNGLEHINKGLIRKVYGGVCRVINTYFKDMTNDEFFIYTLGNAKLEKYEW